ncbi:TspO/MBR family protein [Pseudoduganella sp. GCM10020061]|uniref:TspO/MBR family protein n=1 Tax=Pseudoduganella sp. GCM10020061 TaxID=3317345 RepID=UPI003629EA70
MGQRGKQVKGLLAWFAITFAAAGIGAMASAGAENFYAQLVRPSWAPPGSVFGPVWSVLYTLMALAVWTVWRIRGTATAPRTLALFVVQLVVNAVWSWLFFGLRSGAAAFADAVLLFLLVAATTIAFWRVRPLAGVMMMPYVAWVGFACALTWSTWRLNPQLLG